MKKKITIFCLILFCFAGYLQAQEDKENCIAIGTNLGAYDGFDIPSPVLFFEYNLKINKFICVSPLLLMCHGANPYDYTVMNNTYKLKRISTTLDVGLVAKIIPFPKRFDNLKIIQGLTYLYEEGSPANPQLQSYKTGKGLNYMFGIDIDIIRVKNFKLGCDLRLNSSYQRKLLMYFGLISSFYI